MAYDNVAINFGSPRSGTTLMRRFLGALHDCYATKLHEHNALHPCESDDGLLAISHWMLKDRLVFVRTVRHPLAIADSFVAIRRDGLRQNNEGLASHSDERVVGFIRSESEGFAAQREELLERAVRRGWDHHIVEVRYETLDHAPERRAFAEEVCRHLTDPESNAKRVLRRMDAEWKERPVRDGKLRAGIERAMTEEQEAWFRERLADVIEREGYDDAWT